MPIQPYDAAFVFLERDANELMLQTVPSLPEELSLFESDHAPVPSETTFYGGLHTDSMHQRVSTSYIMKEPRRSCYDMTGLYHRHRHGYVIRDSGPDETLEARMPSTGSSATHRMDGFGTFTVEKTTAIRFAELKLTHTPQLCFIQSFPPESSNGTN